MTDEARILRLATVGARLGSWGIRIWGLGGLVVGFPWILATMGFREEPGWIHTAAGVWVTGLDLLAIPTAVLNYWLPRLTVRRDPSTVPLNADALALAAVGTTCMLLLMLTVVHSEPPWLLVLAVVATAVCLGGFVEGIVRLMRVDPRGR